MAYVMSEQSKQRKREYNRVWGLENRERRKEQARARYANDPGRHRNYALKSYYKHIDNNRRKQNERATIRYRQDKAKSYAINYKSRCKIREETLTHYGGGKLTCVKCGENRLPCLTIDHKNGKGAIERLKLPQYQRAGVNFYRYLRKMNHPVGYQTLCMNCQWIKRAENKEDGRTVRHEYADKLDSP